MRHVVKQTVFATGIGQTAQRVWHEMITPREIGYSGAGTVLGIGTNVEGFQIGQNVAYAATGHAEVTAPSINHVVPVPDGVDPVSYTHLDVYKRQTTTWTICAPS